MKTEQLTYLLDRMSECNQEATNRGVKLRHGTFKQRMSYLMSIRGTEFNSAPNVDHSIAYTLVAYANNQGIDVKLVDVQDRMHEVMGGWLESETTEMVN